MSRDMREHRSQVLNEMSRCFSANCGWAGVAPIWTEPPDFSQKFSFSSKISRVLNTDTHVINFLSVHNFIVAGQAKQNTSASWVHWAPQVLTRVLVASSSQVSWWESILAAEPPGSLWMQVPLRNQTPSWAPVREGLATTRPSGMLCWTEDSTEPALDALGDVEDLRFAGRRGLQDSPSGCPSTQGLGMSPALQARRWNSLWLLLFTH